MTPRGFLCDARFFEVRMEYEVKDLKVCSLRGPLGIDRTPVFGWIVEGDGKNDAQASYRIIVGKDRGGVARGIGDVWDSGTVASDDTLNAHYGGAPLSERTVYYWKVFVRTKRGGGAESAVARFSTGFTDKDFDGEWIGLPDTQPEIGLAGASWIWRRGGAPFDAVPATAQYFRFAFEIPENKTAVRFTLCYTADDKADVYLNGARIGSTFRWTEGAFYTGCEHLVTGKNILAVRVVNTSVSYAGLIVAFRVTYTDGTYDVFATGDGWKCTPSPRSGWEEKSFDDGDWDPVDQSVLYGSAPWGTNVTLSGSDARAATVLRKEFRVQKDVKEAFAYVCGLGFFDLSLNGRKADDTLLEPFITQYDVRVYYRTFDVTALLQQGENAVGVTLGNGFFNETGGVWNWEKAAWRDAPKLLFRLDIRYADGSCESVVSDISWKATRNGPIVSNSLYYGEIYDARKELTGFDKVGYDDAAWENAAAMHAPQGKLSAQMKAPVRRVASFAPASVTKLPGVSSWIVRSPEMVSGWARIRGIRQKRGDRITLTYAQKLLPDGDVVRLGGSDGMLASWFPHAYMQDVYICKGQAEECYEPEFCYKGFEYLRIDGFEGELRPEDVVIYRVSNDVEVISDFSCSSDLFDRLHRNMRVAVTDNFHGERCDPLIEKNGWLGDANVSLDSMAYNFDLPSALPAFIETMGDAMSLYGIVPMMVPTARWGVRNDVVWNSIFVFGVKSLQDYFGTEYLTQRQYDAMRRFILHDIEEIRSNGWVWFDGQLADWVAPMGGSDPDIPYDEDMSEGSGIVGTAYVYAMLKTVTGFAEQYGKDDDAAEYREAAKNILEAFNRKFYNAEKGIYETTVWRQIAKRTRYRQTSNLLPLVFDMVPPEHIGRVTDNLIRDIHEKNDHLDTGCIGTKYILPVLCRFGHAETAYRIASQTTYPSWGFWLTKGAKSTWEMWETSARSLDHYFLGTYEEWFFTHLAGIRNVKNGYKTFTVKPEIVGDLRYVRARIRTVRGPLSVMWKRDGERLTLDLTVPFGAAAEIVLPGAEKTTVGSGSHRFECRVETPRERAENGARIAAENQ